MDIDLISMRIFTHSHTKSDWEINYIYVQLLSISGVPFKVYIVCHITHSQRLQGTLHNFNSTWPVNSPAAQSEPTTSAPHHAQPASSSYATAMRVHHASQNTNVNVLFSSSALPASFPVFVRRTTSQRMDPTVLYTMTFFETFSILLKKIWFRFICIFLNMSRPEQKPRIWTSHF